MADEPKESAVGTVMKNGGGAATGAYVGWTAGTVLGVALAPITGGLSALIPVIGAVVAGKVGHDLSQNIK